MPSPIPFEIHITVANLAINEQDRFIEFCRQHDARPLLIELAKGDFVQQPMLTTVIHSTTLDEALKATKGYTGLLSQSGFAVNRIKIEIPADCAKTYQDNNNSGFSRYYEWHSKINYINEDSLLALCNVHKVHLSINSLKNDTGTRFITLREFGDEATFVNRISKLTNDLKAGGWELNKQHAEYCLYDTNCLLDKGWLPK